MHRIALIHALSESVAPLDAALDREWPECVRMHLLDASLSADLARSGNGLDASFTHRFVALADYARSTGVHGILFSCSAFGPCIEEAARGVAPIPVLKPNEAMIDHVARVGGRIGLVATFPPTLASMIPEFPATAEVQTALAAGALEALRAGDGAQHDALIADAAQRLRDGGCTVIALAQFSMARATDVVAARTRLPVHTTVDSAVRRLRERVTLTEHTT